MRLIDADFEINHYLSMITNPTPDVTMYDKQHALAIVDALKMAKTVDTGRKKGKWNFIGDNMFECTSCGVPYTTQQLNGLRNYNTDPYAPKFCPNCGADMREGDVE